jgi:hypothetical protein
MNDILTYQSKFSEGININVIFEENEFYPMIKTLFNQYGVGFLEPTSQIIMIDGESFIENEQVNINDLHMVEAHEVAHILFGHKKTNWKLI